MAIVSKISRREFLRSTGLSASFVLGAHVAPHRILAAVGGADSAQPNYFVAIASDGTVTLTNSRSEMGQGVRTGMPMILADELEADWDRVEIWQAPGDASKYDPAGKDNQNTDGSRSTRHGFPVMRQLGAHARVALERAAAQKWGVDPKRVYAENHRLHLRDSEQSLDFGEVVDIAAELDLPDWKDLAKSQLKDPSEWRYIGKDMATVDNFDITTGRARYGIDASLPGMKYAVVARPPVYRGKVKSYDDSEALKVAGVEQVIEIPALPDDKAAEYRALGGIAVVASNTWAAMQGRDKLEIEWEDGPFTKHDSETYNNSLKEAARDAATVIRDRGDAASALDAADKVVEAEYFVPYYIHTPMEPPVAVVDANTRPVKVIAPVQDPMQARHYVAEALGLKQDDVECQVTLLGGGFGRKSKCDFACEAAILSKEVGAPVRVQWSREDDVRHGYYHAASAQHVRAGLDTDGKVVAWQHGVAAPTIFALWNPGQRSLSSVETGLGLIDLPYNSLPNIRIQTGEIDTMIRVGWYRSVNNIQHAFAIHSFADELAAAAGRDPLEVMLELIGDAEVMDLTEDGVEEVWNYGDSTDDWPIMPVRLANALRKVAGASNYGKQLPDGQGIGLAAHRSFQSYVATAVQVEVSDDGSLKIPRVDVAIDCGRYVNPEGVIKQVEGGVTYGNTLARHGYVSTTDGAVDQGNFNDYPITRMSDNPMDVQVHILEDYVHMRPCGVGEVGVPPFAPALANAIFAATGKRIRTLPIPAKLDVS